MIQKLYGFLLRRKLRGRGLLIRTISTLHPCATRFPLPIPNLGTIHANLRLGSVVPLFDYSQGDLGHCGQLARYMERFLQPGDSLWDIGANIGTISLHFAQPRFQLSSIEVFEPNPDLVTNLRMIFENLPQVHVNPIAVGERMGEACLHVGGADDSSTGSLVDHQGGERSISVKMATGDSFWRETRAPAPSVIKIDVEGYEPQVFAGLHDLVAAAQPVIFFEHLFLSNEQIQAAIPSGYHWFLILDQGGLSQNLQERRSSHDSLLVPSHRLHDVHGETLRR